MNLVQTVSKMLGREVSEKEAMTFAKEQFGMIAAYLRDNPYKRVNKYSEVSQELQILQIQEDALIDGVVRELKGREAFVDNTDVSEVLYQGDVFEAILGEVGEGLNLNKKVITQLEELSELWGEYDYIQVVNRK